MIKATYSNEGVGTYNPKKSDGTQTYQQDRIYSTEGVLPALNAQLNGRTNILIEQIKFTYKESKKGEVKLNGFSVNDFFCGAGGMGLGFKNAGFEIKGAWDFDKYAVQSYAENVGDHVKELSILDMVGSDVPHADVWTFGFPCQDLSIAGRQAGLFEGKRSGLFFEVMRLLGEVDKLPKVILAENVKGLKPYLPVLKEEYAKAGYVMYCKLFNSKYWGVPQNRERYFVVGIRKDLDKGFFRYPTQKEDFVPKLSSILEENVDEKFYISDERATKVIEQARQRVQLDKPRLAVIGQLDMKGQDNIRRVYDTEGISPTLTTSEGGHRQPKVLSNFRVRKLTPREYARLQGFPDSYKQVVSNSQFYKQMGNAVTVNVAQAIANAIKEVL